MLELVRVLSVDGITLEQQRLFPCQKTLKIWKHVVDFGKGASCMLKGMGGVWEGYISS